MKNGGEGGSSIDQTLRDALLFAAAGLLLLLILFSPWEKSTCRIELVLRHQSVHLDQAGALVLIAMFCL
jgi:hypothetical protein